MSSVVAVSKRLTVHSVLALPQCVPGWLNLRMLVVDDLCVTVQWLAALPWNDLRWAHPQQCETLYRTLRMSQPPSRSFVQYQAQQRVGEVRRRSTCRAWSAGLKLLTRCGYWGTGPDGRGKNMYGKLLSQMRDLQLRIGVLGLLS